VLFVLSSGSSLAAVKPIDEIQVVVHEVNQTLKEADSKTAHPSQDLVRRLQKIIDPVFDFDEMAKRSLGPHWRSLSREQRSEFVPLFGRFLAKAYLGRIASHKSEKVVLGRETVGKSYAEVDTEVASARRDPLPVVYMLKLTDGDWKVYDVIIDNVSIVNNYRAQFDRVISRSSYQDLVRRLKQKVELS
jgi:phospholipid transport system substrate-binding protein